MPLSHGEEIEIGVSGLEWVHSQDIHVTNCNKYV